MTRTKNRVCLIKPAVIFFFIYRRSKYIRRSKNISSEKKIEARENLFFFARVFLIRVIMSKATMVRTIIFL